MAFRCLRWIALAALALAGLAHAAGSAASVADVRMPAWMARGGVRTPLAAGTPVAPGDQLITGDNARVVLQLAEGSEVRIGEDAVVEFSSSADHAAGTASAAQASISVLQGAFRVTTPPDATGLSDILVRMPSLTVGALKADVWGKSASDGEVVCLVDGQVDITGPGTAQVRLDSPLTFYLVTRDAAAPRQASTDLQQMALWADETYLKPGSGAQVAKGEWKLSLVLEDNERAARDQYDHLRRQGYAVEFVPSGTAGHRTFQVTLSGLASEADADALSRQLAKWPGLVPEVVH